MPYDTTNFDALMTKFNGLKTFADVAAWDQEAQNEIQRLESFVNAQDTALANARLEIDRAQQNYSAKNFVARLFSGRGEIERAEQTVAALLEEKDECEARAEKLQVQIDFSPNDETERKLLIKELKQYKKELGVQKKEIAASMREVRTVARQAASQIGPSYGSKWAARYNAVERRNLRLRKESALGPHEDRKSAIERQIISIDKKIIWVERLED